MRITGGFLRNQKLKTPKGLSTRPTSEKLRQAVFNIAQHHIEEAQVLDLFAGSGAIGIEALSRGAKEATFIEKNSSALKPLRENLRDLDLTPLTTLYAGDVCTLLPKLKGETYDLIYIDPPYGKGLGEKALTLIDSLNLLHTGGLLFLEEGQECTFPEFSHLKPTKHRKMGNTFLYQMTTIVG